jgi:hypothetical protein
MHAPRDIEQANDDKNRSKDKPNMAFELKTF